VAGGDNVINLFESALSFGVFHEGRAPLIDAVWRSRLHEYLGGTVQGLGGYPEGVGGVADHVHLLVGLKATHCLADFMRELKKASSVWVHEEIRERGFAWQEGYAAFTVSATARAAVRGYIAKQEESSTEDVPRGVDRDARTCGY
jgi:hypothetical protein